jgi:hypothetical protein
LPIPPTSPFPIPFRWVFGCWWVCFRSNFFLLPTNSLLLLQHLAPSPANIQFQIPIPLCPIHKDIRKSNSKRAFPTTHSLVIVFLAVARLNFSNFSSNTCILFCSNRFLIEEVAKNFALILNSL